MLSESIYKRSHCPQGVGWNSLTSPRFISSSQQRACNCRIRRLIPVYSLINYSLFGRVIEESSAESNPIFYFIIAQRALCNKTNEICFNGMSFNDGTSRSKRRIFPAVRLAFPVTPNSRYNLRRCRLISSNLIVAAPPLFQDTLMKIKSVLVDQKQHIRFGDWNVNEVSIPIRINR